MIAKALLEEQEEEKKRRIKDDNGKRNSEEATCWQETNNFNRLRALSINLRDPCQITGSLIPIIQLDTSPSLRTGQG